MNLIDMHCDTISLIHTNSKGHSFQKDGTTNSSYENVIEEKMNLKKNDLHVDLEKLRLANAKAQFFALFVEYDYLKKIKQTPYNYFNLMYETLMKNLDENKDSIAIARNYDEMEKNFNENKISAFLTIEEGGAIEGKLERIEEVYNKGVRLITITWNHENEIGYPHVRPEFKEKGLKAFGLEVVEKMNELGMIVDVSHLSDLGFYDVARISKKPFIATHSNARFITNHSRNLTDDMIKVLANKGGVTGINFCSAFIGNTSMAMIDDMVKHIKHIKNVGGIESIALGSDFDGIDCPVEIKDVSEMGKLAIKLEQEGFTIDEIEKIYYKNALRVIKDVM